MKEAIKAFLIKLGYSYTCKKCGNKEFHSGRFVGDMIMLALFMTAFYVYYVQEKPMVEEIRNNSRNCYYEEMKNLKTIGAGQGLANISDIFSK